MNFKDVYKYTKELRLLYIEDDANLLKETSTVFENFFSTVVCAANGQIALEIYKESAYDLIITDISMPVMDGEALIKEIRKINNQQDIIVISAYSDSDRLINLIQHNITSFILKPMKLEQLSETLYKVCKNIYAKKNLDLYHQGIVDMNADLDSKVKTLTEEIAFTQQISIETIASMVESYDDETGTHIKRIEKYTSLLVKYIPEHKACPKELKNFVSFASLLHDIGKVFIPKHILNKPSKLTDDEFEIIKKHSKFGGDMLKAANKRFSDKFHKNSYLKVASDIAMYHHEKWDGGGYPEGIKGEDIPMCARVVAIVDVYDALRSKRVYKDGFSHQKSIQIIKDEREKHFDPLIVDIFLEHHSEFEDVFDECIKG